ncbi:MAG: hypothetical protein R3E79_02935 [Caldilineaceae bacterium]
MSETEEIEAMLDMYRETLGMLARVALHGPEMVDELMRVLQLSSVVFVPNAPDMQDEYKTLVGDVVNLLERIKAGEVDARDFLTETNVSSSAASEEQDLGNA